MDRKSTNIRVYEYVADDGTMYWSLTQSATLVSPPTRLLLQDRKGLVLGQFLNQLRSQARDTEDELMLEEEG